MPNKPSSPFTPQGDGSENARIDNYMQFCGLSECFLSSGDALVKLVLEDSALLDVYVYPICFLYRHSWELLLKDLVWKSNYAQSGTKGFPTHHHLAQIWGDVYRLTKTLCGKDFPLTAHETEYVKRHFADIEQHDFGSDSFRYPISISKKKLTRTHPDLTHVNLCALHDQTHQAMDYVHRLYQPVDYICEQRSECESQQSHQA